MKLLFILLLILTIPQVFASKARIESLGQRTWGSNYIESDRLTFINPANINDFNNFIVAEFGTQNSTTSAQADSESTTNGEGGAFIKGDTFNYGVYLGNESNDAYIVKLLSGMAGSTRPMLNRWEIFVGQEQSALGKWGAGVWFAHGSDEQTVPGNEMTQTSLGLKFGLKGSNYRFGIVQGLMEKVEGTTSSSIGNKAIMKGKFMTMINGGYDLNNKLTLITELIRVQVEKSKANSAAFNGKLTMDSHFVGVGYKIHNDKKVNVYADATVKYVNFDWNTVTHRNSITAATLDTYLAATGLARTQLYVPLNIAAEVKARSWLTFRGAITQRMWGYDKKVGGAKITKKNGRTVTAGIGLNFDNLDIDGLVQSRNSANSEIGTNDIMSRVAATYYW